MIEHRSDLLADFWHFVTERDAAWRRREVEGQPWPWTDDLVIRDYHFTNVHRHKDNGTRLIMSYLRGEPDAYGVLFTCAAYRGLNNAATSRAFGLPDMTQDSVTDWRYDLLDARERGVSIGSPRHLTSLRNTISTLRYMTDNQDVLREVWAMPDAIEMTRALVSMPGLGPFFAVQVVADALTYPSATRAAPSDAMCSLAIGSRTAARMILYGESLNKMVVDSDNNPFRRDIGRLVGLDPDELALMRLILDDQPAELSAPLGPIDVEHCLCEWKRYARLKSNDGWVASMMRRQRPT